MIESLAKVYGRCFLKYNRCEGKRSYFGSLPPRPRPVEEAETTGVEGAGKRSILTASKTRATLTHTFS